uniref:Major facilitator superfamily domain-containing protein 3 n=1 Tax=Phallusia mammillata TaxID=59560 RepID=A0A6F9DLD7_9ASCI|nr:major facilitator superfamily domain-containing protein 3 [Phallusia mammillata]
MQSQIRALASLCILYFLQGIPYGVQMKALPLYLYESLNFTMNAVTKTGLLMTPWIFLKPLLSAYVTTETAANTLIYTGIAGNILLNLLLSFTFLFWSQHNVIVSFLDMFALFIINVASVAVDISTDRLAITSAQSGSDLKFLGISNTVQVVAYKVGAMFGGIALSLFVNIAYGFLVIAILNVAGLIVVSYLISATDRPHSESKQEQAITRPTISFSMFSISSLKYLCIFILTYKLGENGSLTIYPLLLIDKNVSRHHVAMYSSLLNEPLSFLGSIIGGCVWSFHQPKKPYFSLCCMIAFACGLRVAPIGLQYLVLSAQIDSLWPLASALLSFFGGMLTTLTFTLMMVASHKVPDTQKATVYAILSSCEVLGKLVFSCFVGYLVTLIGVLHVYMTFTGLLTLPMFALLWFYKCVLMETKRKEE